jgi:hypothetical protein
MSEEPTKNLDEKYDTKPMLETILTEMRAGFERVEKRLDGFDVRLDRVASDTSATRAEMLTLRADFHEFRVEVRDRLKEPA